jgi:hypothetical protein
LCLDKAREEVRPKAGGPDEGREESGRCKRADQMNEEKSRTLHWPVTANALTFQSAAVDQACSSANGLPPPPKSHNMLKEHIEYRYDNSSV